MRGPNDVQRAYTDRMLDLLRRTIEETDDGPIEPETRADILELLEEIDEHRSSIGRRAPYGRRW